MAKKPAQFIRTIQIIISLGEGKANALFTNYTSPKDVSPGTRAFLEKLSAVRKKKHQKKPNNTFLLCKLVPRRDLFRNMILHSEFKRKKQQLTTPEKAAAILKASHQLHLHFITSIIPATSIGILLEVRIIGTRETLDQAVRLWQLAEHWHVPFPPLPL